jgi:hypothetical protein
MDQYKWTVYEYFPGDDGDEKRLIYTFDNEESAVGIVHFIETNDRGGWPCVGVEKEPVDG